MPENPPQAAVISGSPPVVVKTRYCLYARRSSEAEERQALSVEAQVSEMLKIAERDELEVVEVRRESHSAKESGQRPVFADVVAGLREGRFNGILVWHPDRLSRNAGDLGALVDLMDQKKLAEIRTYGQAFADSPSDKFLLMILCSQAKLENDNRGVNIKRGLRARVEAGLWPGIAPVGYLNQRRLDRKCQMAVDPDRAPIIRQMFEKVARDKWSGRKLYHWLRFELNFKSVGEHHLALSNVYRVLTNPFYYGRFEHPKGSGNWYDGKHEPLVTKELFDAVQAQLTRDGIERQSHEFAFTKLMTCGRCGSGISAEEKFKKLKNGTVAKYIYYGCGRSRDRFCKNPYIREDELVEQLTKLLDRIDLSQTAVQMKFEAELRRHNKFSRGVLGGAKAKAAHREVDLATYAKYLLREGTNEERRELLGCFKSRIAVKDKRVRIETY